MLTDFVRLLCAIALKRAKRVLIAEKLLFDVRAEKRVTLPLHSSARAKRTTEHGKARYWLTVGEAWGGKPPDTLENED